MKYVWTVISSITIKAMTVSQPRSFICSFYAKIWDIRPEWWKYCVIILSILSTYCEIKMEKAINTLILTAKFLESVYSG